MIWEDCGKIRPKFLSNVTVECLFWTFNLHAILVEFSLSLVKKENIFRKTFFKILYKISHKNENCVCKKDTLANM